MANKLNFEDTYFLNEDAMLGISIGLIALYSSFIAGVAYYAKKKYDKYKKDNKSKEIQTKKERRILSLQEKIDGYNKVYHIDKSFLNPIDKDYKSTKDIFNDMLKDAKYIANKITSSDVFKANCDEAKVYLKHRGYTVEDIAKIDYDFFKNAISIEEGINGYEETMQILDEDQDVMVAMNWITSDIGNMLEMKYMNYVSNMDIGEGDEGHLYYNLHLKTESGK